MHERVLCQLPDCDVDEDDCSRVRIILSTEEPVISSATFSPYQATTEFTTIHAGLITKKLNESKQDSTTIKNLQATNNSTPSATIPYFGTTNSDVALSTVNANNQGTEPITASGIINILLVRCSTNCKYLQNKISLHLS